MIRILLTAAVLAMGLAGPLAAADEKPAATLYKNPQCGCCEEYAGYLRKHGYAVTVKPTHNLPQIKRQFGVPERFEGCHTTLIDRYVVEGHVPVKTLDKLLSERPEIRGISVPGMPQGSPGMTGRKTEPLVVYEISKTSNKVYARE